MDLLPPDELRYQLEHIHDNKAPGVIASLVICFTLACTAVLLRFISRRMCKAGIGSDDYTILAALVGEIHCVHGFHHCHLRLLNRNPLDDRFWFSVM